MSVILNIARQFLQTQPDAVEMPIAAPVTREELMQLFGADLLQSSPR